ncbi:MAG: hypothetical protein ACI4RO_00135, partial [Candidatus Scatosoma sp.]
WHTFTLSWDPATRTVTGTMDGNAYFTNTAMNEDTFVSNVARFTLGGYYTDPLNGGRGITSTDGNYCAFEGNIRNVTITKTETGNEFNKLMSYDFTDAEVGKANESAYDLVEWGEGATYDSEKGALYSPKSSVLVPKGFNRIANQKNDFWDYMAGEDFTVSTSFMLPKTIAESEKAEGRGVLFSLWGLWAGTTYGGTADCNLVSSSVIYDAYASGADKANIRIGFLYQNGTDDSGNPTTENGWWSNKEGAVTTDEFHTLAISMKGLTCTVYLDGVQFASFDCYAGNAWGNVGTTFALGGAAGVGGTAGGSAYFKYFDVYDFAMSGSELSALNRGQLNLTEAAYISSAAEVSSAVTVIKNTPNDEILAESPTVSDVTVTLSDGSTPTAKAIWTGVEKQGDNVYLVGTILAAGASNPNGVKARMPVTFVAQAKEVSLTLDGTIGLNYYFSLIDTVVAEESEAVLIWKAEDNSVLGTVELKGYTVKGTESKTDWYKFTYAVAAKDYKNKITAEISDGETVLESVT